jgi:hypothetical protein
MVCGGRALEESCVMKFWQMAKRVSLLLLGNLVVMLTIGLIFN